MKAFGNTWRKRCPICDEAFKAGLDGTSEPVLQNWRIPFSKIDTITVAGGYFNMAPMLRADAVLYGFSVCPKCESVCVNPYDGDSTASYVLASYPVERITDPQKMLGHKAQYASYIRGLLLNTPGGRMLDAGCGIGQYMFLAAEDLDAKPAEIIGLELSRQAVKEINSTAVQRNLAPRVLAYECNLCKLHENTGMLTSLGLFDTIVLSETFEHLDYPGVALETLAGLLKPGGSIFYTAQAPDGGLAIRPTEPIYMSRVGQDILIERIGLRLIRTELAAGRWKTILLK